MFFFVFPFSPFISCHLLNFYWVPDSLLDVDDAKANNLLGPHRWSIYCSENVSGAEGVGMGRENYKLLNII